MVMVVLLLTVFASGGARGQTIHNVTHAYLDEFTCTQNASVSSGTTLAGNSAALETLRQWCAADPRCAQLYGQDVTPKLALFVHLFQTTYAGSVSAAQLEEPLFDLLCNKTAEEFLAAAWVLILNQQILDSSNVCDVNERPVLNSNTGQVDCDCQPGKVCDAQTGSFVGATIVSIALILAVTAQFGAILWYNTNRAQVQRLGRGLLPTQFLSASLRRSRSRAATAAGGPSKSRYIAQQQQQFPSPYATPAVSNRKRR